MYRTLMSRKRRLMELSADSCLHLRICILPHLLFSSKSHLLALRRNLFLGLQTGVFMLVEIA